MSQSRYDFINDLAHQIKGYPMYPIVAKRLLEDFDEDGDYSRTKFLCPFHNDNHAGNFSIKNGMYKCFVCDASGGAIDFIMKMDGLPFLDAVLQAAVELGIISEEDKNRFQKKKTNSISYQKINYVPKKSINKKANKETLNKVYTLFSKGLTYLNKPRLKEEHMQLLKETRNLTDEEIENIGYFTFPSLYILKHLIKELNAMGIDEDILYSIPGFYYNKKKEKISFMTLSKNSGIGIPIKDIDGDIIGIQIRLDTKTKDDQRYIWFSSAFAINEDEKASKGSSPGAPIDVVYPNCGVNNMTSVVFITEGHFKAMKIAKEFHSIALSVQGVHNWRDIPYVLDELKKKYPILKHLYIMYDADMSYKETVLNPALKLGLSLTNLNFKGLKESVEQILSLQKDKPSLLKFKTEFQNVTDYLKMSAGAFKFDIVYCLWDDAIGKGIDDYLEQFDDIAKATSQIKKVQLIPFWKNAYYYLLANEQDKKKIALSEGIQNFNDVSLPSNILKENFNKEIFNK